MMSLNWIKTKPEIINSFKGYRLLLLGIFTIFLLHLIGYHHHAGEDVNREKIFIQISGAVMCPGIYSFSREAGLREVIRRGGGLMDRSASVSSIGDVPIRSGEHVTIIRRNGVWAYTKETISAFHKVTLGIPVSLNTESEEGLTAIPGIGPGLADTIIREREKRGGFKNPEELKSLYGIGSKVYKRIIPFINL